MLIPFYRRFTMSTKRLTITTRYAATAALLCALWAPQARAQQTAQTTQSGTTVWFMEAASLDEATRANLRKSLNEALAGEPSKHVVGDKAFETYVKARQPTPPDCLLGKQPCVTPRAMTFNALNVGLVIRMKVRKSDGRYEAVYTLTDRRGQTQQSKVARGDDPRALGFALVRAITNATGVVSIVTTPPGAMVRIDGADIGRTPLKHRLPIGSHRYTLQLEPYAQVEGQLEVAPKDTPEVSKELSLLPGMLAFEGAPLNTTISIDGQPPRPANAPIELPPGTYTYELQAPGHAPQKGDVTIEAGAMATRPGALVRVNPLLRPIPEASLRNNRYTLRLSYDHSVQWTTFRGARGTLEEANLELEFRRFTNQDEVDGGEFFDTNGLRLEFAYAWEDFGITLFSLGYLSDSTDTPVEVEDLEARTVQTLRMVKLRQLQLRPLQLSYRTFYHNIVPSVEAGVGINVQWADIEFPNLPNPIGFRQTEAFWTVGVGAQYFFTPQWFAGVRYNFHGHLNRGVGAQHVFSFGVGGALPNAFGVEPEPPAKIQDVSAYAF